VRNLGPEGRTAVRSLGRPPRESPPPSRPRYPAVGAAENKRLKAWRA
jgi:hypothetical protein